MRTLLILILVLIGWAAMPCPAAFASATPWKKSDEVSSRLIVGNADEKGIRKAGYELHITGHWHTYWKFPGDSGRPPEIDWRRSENVKSVELVYPAPERISKKFEGFDPVETFGYGGELVYPLLITPLDPSQTIRLDLTVNYAVCDETCIFESDKVTETISSVHKDDETTAHIDAFLARAPKADSKDVSIGEMKLLPEQMLEVKVTSAEPFEKPDLFVNVTPDFRFLAPEAVYSDDRKQATLKIRYKELLADKHVAGMEATLTLVDRNRGAEIVAKLPAAEGIVATAPAQPLQPAISIPPTSTGTQSLLFILITAFLGGLILNIMPCVLPVLALKLVGVARHGGGSKLHVRASFLASVLGILVSFAVLSAIMIALKSAGNAVGWGLHFQQPVFLIALIIAINLFAANQWSLFEINLPSWLGGRVSNALPGADDHTLTGHFMMGAFAAILATPCSAPYLGTAVGFALSQGTPEILMIFGMMGLGLAFPYLACALMPSLITVLPKPGAWMLRVKHFMGYLLIAASVWLIWVLSSQLGLYSALAVAMFSASSVGLLWLHKRQPIDKTALSAAILVGLAITFALPLALSGFGREEKQMQNGIWQPFDEAKIAGLVAKGDTVFVDVTADWCLTCKFNKLHVLDTPEVQDMLTKKNTVAMLADYTSPAPEIRKFLEKHGRYAIPFNIVYGPAAPEGIPLPELLTKESVLEALKKAGK